MNQQTMDEYLKIAKEILKQVEKLKRKEKELNRREQDILTIKDNTTQILKLLKGKEGTKTIIKTNIREPSSTTIETKIQSLNKAKEIKHHSPVSLITELSDLRIATGDDDGYLTLFKVNYDNEQWTKIKEEKDMINGLLLFVN